MTSLFTVTDNEIKNLDQTVATEFFAKLLRSEAYRVGLPLSSVQISTWVNVGDGGVDARVEGLGSVRHVSNIFLAACTSYQIKTSRTGKSFSPTSESDLKNELFGSSKDTDIKADILGAETRRCFDEKGVYVLLCFALQLTPQQRTHSEALLVSLLTRAGIDSPQVQVWGFNNLRDFIHPFPSLVLDLKNMSSAPFQTYSSWALNGDMKTQLIESDEYKQRTNEFADLIRDRIDAVHFRVLDEAGAGKTRFVLESTKYQDLAPLVVYTTGNQLVGSDLLLNICRDDNNFEVILIADECDSRQSSEVWNKVKGRGQRIVLITIFNKIDAGGSDTRLLELPKITIETTKKIIESYGVKDRLDTWSELAGDSPRFAHLIGFNLREYPEDILKPIDNLLERMIAGTDDPTSPVVAKRMMILMYVSLFKRFGYGASFTGEAKMLWEFIHSDDSNVSWNDFRGALDDLRSRKLIQGDATLYISPAGLHIRLWIDWWKKYGDAFDYEQFSQIIPEGSQLIGWFYEMFQYAESTTIAQRLLDDLFGPGGMFEKHELLKKKFGGKLLIELSKIDPDRVLLFVEKYIQTKSTDELLLDVGPRRDLVWSLEYLVIPRHLFERAARLLLKLAEAENEKGIGNNASGVFVDLYSTGWGELAPSEASPIERMGVLREAFNSVSLNIRDIGIKAASKALETRYFVRDIGTGELGIGKKFKRWTPKTWDEIHGVYIQIWDLLLEYINKLDANEKKAIAEVFVEQMRDLAGVETLYKKMITTYGKLLEMKLISKEDLLKSLSYLLHYDTKNIKVEIAKEWEEFRDSLLSDTTKDRLERYVGMDLIDDHFDSDGKRVRVLSDKFSELAGKLCKNHDEFLSHLEWLVGPKAKKASAFGLETFNHDSNQSLLKDIVSVYIKMSDREDLNPDFLGGYLRGMFESNVEQWENTMEELSENVTFLRFFPELIWRSGMSDKTAQLLLTKALDGKVSYRGFAYFGYGSVIANLGEKVFVGWIDFLIKTKTLEGIAIALDLVQYYYLGRKHGRKHEGDIPLHPTLELLTNTLLVTPNKEIRNYQMIDHNWSELIEPFVKKYSGEVSGLARFILSSFGKEDTIFDSFDSAVDRSLTDIAKINPELLWKELTPYFDPPYDRTKFRIHHWLEGHRFSDELKGGTLNIFPIKLIFAWVSENPKERSEFIASISPQDIYENNNSVALELLKRYGDNIEVRRELLVSYIGGGWTGPESLHHEKKKNKLIELGKREDNLNLNLWISEFIKYLDDRIKDARLEEERDLFA